MASWRMVSPSWQTVRTRLPPFCTRSACRHHIRLAWATILTEVVGGLAVILGAFVTLVSLPMTAILLVAMFTVHLPYGFSSIKLMAVTPAGVQFGPPGFEVDLLYVACLAALVLSGPGPFAIDGILRRRNKVGRS